MKISPKERRKVALAFGQVLREFRLRKGLSQARLAALCKLDRNYPYLLERGLRTPTLTVIYEVCAVLEIEPERMVARVYEELGRM